MMKILDFIKTHLFAAINIAGIFLVIMTFLYQPFAAMGFLIYAYFQTYILIPILVISALIAINIAAFYTVKNSKTISAIILTVLGGSIGAMLGVRVKGKDFSASKAVKIIFLIDIWITVWLILGYLLFCFEYYTFSLI